MNQQPGRIRNLGESLLDVDCETAAVAFHSLLSSISERIPHGFLASRFLFFIAEEIRIRQDGDTPIAASFEELLALRDPEAFPILLAHHPHAFDPAAAARLPLTLSGHTHGGQLMLNAEMGFGPLMFRYWSGHYTHGDSHLIVSNGVGNWFPLRTRVPPAEITYLTL